MTAPGRLAEASGWVLASTMSELQTTGNRLERLVQVDPDVVRHAARVSVWARWFVWVSAAGLLAYRPGLWFPHDIGYVFLNTGQRGSSHGCPSHISKMVPPTFPSGPPPCTVDRTVFGLWLWGL